MSIIIREASPFDAEQIVGLIRDVHAEPIPTSPRTLDEVPYTLNAEREHIEHCLKTDNSVYYVAEYQGRVIGVLTLDGGSIRATRHTAVSGISVDKEHRGRGVGKQLMLKGVEWAKSAGIQRIELKVFANNQPAIGLYESFGFEMEGHRRKALLIGDDLIDDYIMALLLD